MGWSNILQFNTIVRAPVLGTVSPSIVSSRSTQSNTGVAPFSVVVHACNTTDTETTNPFRDCSYVWNFGETTGPGVGTWGSNAADPSSSRNWGYEPVAGHIYETPGTYVITGQVTSAVTGNIAAATTTITVLDPDVVYAGSKTVCVSSSSDFTGAPFGCIQLTASSTNAIKPYLANGMRFLFRAGETFHQATTTDVINLTGYSGCTVGKFGPGARPIISFDVGDGTGFSSAIGFGNDCRYMDLAIVGRTNLVTGHIDNGAGASGNTLTVTAVLGSGSPLAVGDSIFPSAATGLSSSAKITALGTGTGGVGTYTISVNALVASTNFVTGNYGCRGFQCAGTGVAYNTETQGYCTLLRCDFQRCASDIILDGIAPAVQDCTTSNHSGEPGVFPGAGNTGACSIFCIANGTQFQYIAGNSFDRSTTGEHAGRFQGSCYSVYEANYFRGANSTKTLLATRGMVGASVNMLNTSYVVRNNRFDYMGGVNISTALEVQLHNATFYEPNANVIISHNYFSQYDYNGNFYSPVDCNVLGSNITIRHNVHNHSSQMSTGNNSGHRGVVVTGQSTYTNLGITYNSPTPPSDNVLIANETVYSNTAVRFTFVSDTATPTNVKIKNVLAYAPNTVGTSGSSTPAIWSGTATPTLTNNTPDASIKTLNPLFTNPTTYAGFTLGLGSYAIGLGQGIDYNPAAV